MLSSAFVRRASNTQGPAVISSSPPTASPSHQHQQAMSVGNTSAISTNHGSIGGTNINAAGYLGSEVSEFGSIGDFSREESSTTTSPSLSPIIGGNQGSFQFGLPPALNPSILQSLQASNDAQSLHSATSTVFPASSTSTFLGSSIGTGQTDLFLQENFARRIRCLSYLKRCLSIVFQPNTTQGMNANSTSPLWMDVIKLSKRDIEVIYESEKMKKRASRNYFLGCSIGPIIDYNSSAEFARAVLAIFNEAETIGEGGERDKTKMKNFFKSSVKGRKSGLGDWESGSGSGGIAASGFGAMDTQASHVPFSLDYFQTTITLFDMLVEMYHKLTLFLQTGREASTKEMDNTVEGQSSNVTPSTLDMMNKTDGKVKKILSQVCKELDALARHVIREELASIDPVMAKELGLLDGRGAGSGSESALQQVLDT